MWTLVSTTLVLAFFLFYWSRRINKRPTPAALHYTTQQAEPVCIHQPATVTLSVVVPAYNEATRITHMLHDTLLVLEKRKKQNKEFTYEIVVVDDGSTDLTCDTVAWAAKDRKVDTIRIIQMQENRGKGAAVAQGMLRARGEYIIFADADGASTFADIQLLEEQMRTIRNADGYGVVVGSRAHLVETDAVVQRSLVRNLLMYAFHAYVHLLGIKSIKDTQCGFKLFSRKAAARVFPNVHVDGWIFDIELFVIMEKCNIPVAEVPIRWEEVDGSKMSLMRDAITMALDLLIIRLNYWLGIWTIGKVKRKR